MRKGPTWHHQDEQLFEMTNETAGPMPGYESDMPPFKGALRESGFER